MPATAYFVIQQDLVLSRDEAFKLNPNTIANRIARDVVLYPLLVVSHRMMVSKLNWKASYTSINRCVRDTYNKFGIRGFYRGIQLNMVLHLYLPYYYRDRNLRYIF